MNLIFEFLLLVAALTGGFVLLSWLALCLETR